MTEFALCGIQLALQIGHRTWLGRRRSPPSDGRDQLSPGVKQVGTEAQLLPHQLSRLPAVEPVLDRLAFKGFVKFPTAFNNRFFDGLDHTRLCPILCPSIRGNLNLSTFRGPVTRMNIGPNACS